jgi:hypothetical protein
MTKAEITELADAHWGYVKSVLEAHNEDPKIIEQCGFHYREAFIHGFKHGVEPCGVEMRNPRKRRRNSNTPGAE